jgi:hypothetical protein
MIDNEETEPTAPVFDPAAYPEDTLIHDRRKGGDRRQADAAGEATEPIAGRRVKQNRRRRIDPTTFEKQYTDDEVEFMNAIQRFKTQSGKAFPTHGDSLRIAIGLGYRQVHKNIDHSAHFQALADDVQGADGQGETA